MATPPAGSITLTVTTEADDVSLVAVSAAATVAELATAVEAHTGVPAAQQRLLFNGRDLAPPSARLDAAGVRDGDLLLVLRRAPGGGAGAAAGARAGAAAAAEAAAMARGPDGAAVNPEAFQAALRANTGMIQDPHVRQALLGPIPEMQRFLRLDHEHRKKTEAEERRRIALLNADPFDIDAQRSIEEAIARENVEASYQQAMDETPELLVGQVFMLYVPFEANGVALKAFVDSGAQMTIMSAACARRCGVMRLLDTRYAGIARGVGEQKILGRVHALSIKVGAAYLPCSISVLEKDDEPSFIFGLDMLKRHQCCIDLATNCLVIGTTGERVPFLSEAELPRGAGPFGSELPEEAAPSAAGGAGPSAAAAAPPAAPAAAPGAAAAAAPPAAPAAAGGAPAALPAGVAQLVELGFPAAAAAEALAACGGNAEQAAALLFSGTF